MILVWITDFVSLKMALPPVYSTKLAVLRATGPARSVLLFARTCSVSRLLDVNCHRHRILNTSDMNSLSTAVGHSYFVLPCPANSSVGAWCCSADGSDCCDDSFDMQMATLPTASQTSAPSCPSSTATSGGSSHSSGSKSTVAIGAGVGVSLGVCFLASLAGLFAQRRMYQRRLDEKDQLLNSQLAVGYTRSGIAEANQAGHDNAALLQRLNAGPRELEATKKTTTFELGSDGK